MRHLNLEEMDSLCCGFLSLVIKRVTGYECISCPKERAQIPSIEMSLKEVRQKWSRRDF